MRTPAAARPSPSVAPVMKIRGMGSFFRRWCVGTDRRHRAMALTAPAATAAWSTPTADARSDGGPKAYGPASCIAPCPDRRTCIGPKHPTPVTAPLRPDLRVLAPAGPRSPRSDRRSNWKLALVTDCGRVVRQYAQLRVQGGKSDVAVEHLDLAVAQVPEVGGREVDLGPRRPDYAGGRLERPRSEEHTS